MTAQCLRTVPLPPVPPHRGILTKGTPDLSYQRRTGPVSSHMALQGMPAVGPTLQKVGPLRALGPGWLHVSRHTNGAPGADHGHLLLASHAQPRCRDHAAHTTHPTHTTHTTHTTHRLQGNQRCTTAKLAGGKWRTTAQLAGCQGHTTELAAWGRCSTPQLAGSGEARAAAAGVCAAASGAALGGSDPTFTGEAEAEAGAGRGEGEREDNFWEQSSGGSWPPVAGIPQDDPLSHRELADSDGLFMAYRGVEVHFKRVGPVAAGAPPEQPRAASGDAAGAPGEEATRQVDGARGGVGEPGEEGPMAPQGEEAGGVGGKGPSEGAAEEEGPGFWYSGSSPSSAASGGSGTSGGAGGTGGESLPRLRNLRMGAILLHGFGASLFSWEPLMRPLAECLCGPVVAFDRPAFGLTQRVPPPPLADALADPGANPYSLEFSAGLAVEFGRRLQEETGSRPIVVGHSAGCLVALKAVLDAPDLFSGLVLVAPAILPPLLPAKGQASSSADEQPPAGVSATQSGSVPAQAQAAGEDVPMDVTGNAATSAATAAATAAGGAAPSAVAAVATGAGAGAGAGIGAGAGAGAGARAGVAAPSSPAGASVAGAGAAFLRALKAPFAVLASLLGLLALRASLALVQLIRATVSLASQAPFQLSRALQALKPPPPSPATATAAAGPGAATRDGEGAGAVFSLSQWSRALQALRHAAGALGLLLVSLLSLLLVQLVLLLNGVAQGITALARPLGFGWRGLSSAATAALLRNAVAVAVLRRAFDAIGVRTVMSAWSNREACTPDVIQGYTKPLRSQHWDKALLEFVIAAGLNPPLADKLATVKCPALVMTGDRDVIVPAWNARRVAASIPGSTFEMIPQCGHVPQEEKAEEVLRGIMDFLQKTQGQ